MVGQYIEGYEISIDDRVCINPDRCGKVDTVGCANSYYCPAGLDPGYADLLLTYKDMQEVAENTTNTMTLVYDRHARFIKNLRFVGAKKVSDGPLNDNSVMLCRFGDVRILLEGRSLDSDLYANLFMPATSLEETQGSNTEFEKQVYVLTTLNADDNQNKVPFTWERLLKQLWPLLFGTLPGLPGYVDELPNPETLALAGTSNKEILETIFRILGVVPAYNPWEGVFQPFWELGTDLTIANPPDDEPIWEGAIIYPPLNVRTWIPTTVKVKFVVKSEFPGSEWDADMERNWIQDSVFTVNRSFGGGGGSMAVWAPLHAKRNDVGDISNMPEITAEGNRIADLVFRELSLNPYHRIYSGFRQVVTDGRCKAFRVGRCKGGTCFTELIAHWGPPMEYQHSAGPMGVRSLDFPKGWFDRQETKFPALPYYPRETQTLIIKSDTSSEDFVFSKTTTEGTHVFDASLSYFPKGELLERTETGSKVFVMIALETSISEEKKIPLPNGLPVIARRVGVAQVTPESDDEADTFETRPLYMADRPTLSYYVEGYECIAPGAEGEVKGGPRDDILKIKNTSQVEIHKHLKFWIVWDIYEEAWVPLADMDKDRIVKVTGSEISTGRYPGVIQAYVGGSWIDLCQVEILDLSAQ